MRIIVTIAQRAKTKNYLSCLCMVQCLENNYKRIFFGETEKKNNWTPTAQQHTKPVESIPFEHWFF